jgi:Protein of unknown function (DUF3551)
MRLYLAPQCNASASGRAAQCIVNPYYAGRKQRRRDGETGGIAASIEGGVYRKPCRYPSDLTNEEWALVEPLIARPSVASGAGDMRAMRSLR